MRNYLVTFHVSVEDNIKASDIQQYTKAALEKWGSGSALVDPLFRGLRPKNLFVGLASARIDRPKKASR